MTTLKRAMISLRRLRGKTLLLIGIFFLVGTAVSGIVSLRQAISTTEAALRRDMLPILTLSYDIGAASHARMHEGWTGEEVMFITRDLFQEISDMPEVIYSDFSNMLLLHSNELAFAEPITGWMPGVFSSLNGEGSSEWYRISGVAHPDFLDLRQRFIEVSRGTTFTEGQIQNGDFVMMVSEHWAAYHGLNVGDTVSLFYTIRDGSSFVAHDLRDVFFDFKIIGFFDVNLDTFGVNPEDIRFSSFDTVSNETHRIVQLQQSFYMPNETIANIRNHITTNYHSYLSLENLEYYEIRSHYANAPIFILEDPWLLESFSERIEPMLPDFFVIHELLNRFEPISSAMATMNEFGNGILAVAVGAAVIILVLTLMIFLRDRRHELGLLLALGESKAKVMLQMFYETAFCGIIGITLALASGHLISSQLSQVFMEEQLSAAQLGNQTIMQVNPLEWLGFGEPMSGEEMLEFFDFSLSGSTVALFYLFMFGIMIVGLGLSLIYVIRMKPKKILE